MIRDDSEDTKKVATVAAAMVQNARSVISLSLFARLYAAYSTSLLALVRLETKPVFKIAILTGVSQFVFFSVWALCFWYV